MSTRLPAPRTVEEPAPRGPYLDAAAEAGQARRGLLEATAFLLTLLPVVVMAVLATTVL